MTTKPLHERVRIAASSTTMSTEDAQALADEVAELSYELEHEVASVKRLEKQLAWECQRIDDIMQDLYEASHLLDTARAR